MPKLIGTNPNQVPVNGMLGKLAFVDKDSAGNVINVPAGNIAATNVQAAINELDTEKQAVLVSGTTLKTINSTSLLGSGNIVTTTGTVTSVAVTVPSIFSITGSPITTSGTFAITYSGTALPVANGGTGATTLTGLVKGNGTGAFTAATVRTDYAEPTTALATGILKNTTTTGAHTIAVAETDYVTPSGAGTLSNKTLAATTLSGAITGGDFAITRVMLKDTGYNWWDSNTTSALDYVNGSVQRWAPTGTVTFSVTNWPPSGSLGELLIEGVNLGAATITWPTIGWIKSDGTMTTSFAANGVTLQTSGNDWVILWTRDGGTNIYGKIVR